MVLLCTAQTADKNMKKPRQISVVDNRGASTSYDNDAASGSGKDDDDNDDDDEYDYDEPHSDVRDEFDENYVNNNSNRNRKRKGTAMLRKS